MKQIYNIAIYFFCLLLRRKAMTNLDNVLKSRDIMLTLAAHILKKMERYREV